jgi:hypothetical protein
MQPASSIKTFPFCSLRSLMVSPGFPVEYRTWENTGGTGACGGQGTRLVSEGSASPCLVSEHLMR